MRISIRYQILALVTGVVALALAAFLVLAVRLFSRDQLAYIYELESSLTATMAEEVRASVASRVDKLGYFAVQPDAEVAAQALLATDPDLLAVEVWRPRDGKFVRDLRHVDAARLEKLNLRDEDLVEARRTAPVPFEAVRVEGALLQNASLPPDLAVLSLAAAPPGTDAVVVALVRPDRLLKIFARSAAYRAYLVDGKGHVIVDPDPQRVLARANDGAVPLVREATLGSVARGVREIDGPAGPVIGAFARVGVGRLAVVAEIPRAEALRATAQMERRSVLFAAAILFLAVLASVAMGRRLTAPLRRLEEATRLVAQGDLVRPVEVSGRSEIGSLAASFNLMALALRDREARLSEAHQELMHAERLSVLGEMAAGVVHDVRNPVAAILGFAAMGRESTSPDEIRECFETIEEAGGRAREIVETLLRFASHDQPELVDVDVAAVIDDTLRMLKYQLLSASIHAVADVAPDLPPVRANRGQLQQALVNLVVNATHAMEGRPVRRLGVLARVDGGLVHVSVEDTGSGIPPDVLARLFTPFFTTKKRGKGTGLGLSMSLRILRSFGGDIAVTSRVGEGSTFTLRIPLEDEVEAPEAAAG